MGWSPVQGVLPTEYRIKKLKSGQGPKGCRAIEREKLGDSAAKCDGIGLKKSTDWKQKEFQIKK
jgi:hypothetical protein